MEEFYDGHDPLKAREKFQVRHDAVKINKIKMFRLAISHLHVEEGNHLPEIRLTIISQITSLSLDLERSENCCYGSMYPSTISDFPHLRNYYYIISPSSLTLMHFHFCPSFYSIHLSSLFLYLSLQF